MLRKLLTASVLMVGCVAIAPSAMAQIDDSTTVEFTGDIDFDCQISTAQNGTLRPSSSKEIVTLSRGRADIFCNVPYKLVVDSVVPDAANPSTTTSGITLFTSAGGSGRFNQIGANGGEVNLSAGQRSVYPAITADISPTTDDLAPGSYRYTVDLTIANP